MMQYQRMPLYLCIKDLQKLLVVIVDRIPRFYKYMIGQDAIILSLKLMDNFCYAQTLASSDSSEKIRTIKKINFLHICLTNRVRILGDIPNAAPIKQQAQLNLLLVESGRMIGSWLKKVPTQ